MKKFFLVLLATLAFATGSALGADMYRRAPLYKAPPPPAPVYNWTGFYLNAGVGYGMWTADTTTVFNEFSANPGVCDLCFEQRQGGRGWLGRLGGGFDYQFSDRIVAGVLADYDFTDLRGTIQDRNPFFAANLKENNSWAVGARLGWLIVPQVLSYVEGGFSQAHFNSAGFIDTFGGEPATFNGAQFATPSFTDDGWFIGGGVESSLSGLLPFLPTGLFMRTEYRFASYDTRTLTDCAGIVSAATCNDSITFRPDVQTITTSVVWRFNWTGGPFATRY